MLTKSFVLFLAVLAVLYFALFSLSQRGYGYAGYGAKRDERGHYYGYHSPSIFYWGGASFWRGDSVRNGSAGGGGFTGRGPGAGK